MGGFLLSFFLVIFSLSAFYEGHQQIRQDNDEMITTNRQRAVETVQYINTINDYLYDHPAIRHAAGEVTLTPEQTGRVPAYEIHHVIFNHRVWVWQGAVPGLMTALKKQTVSSALLGTVHHRQLTDNAGTAMQVSVPASIPDGAVVYLN